jgi:hypothetical protein
MTKYLFIFILIIYGCQENTSDESLIVIRTEIAELKSESDSLKANFNLKSVEKFNVQGQLESKVEYYDNGKPEHEYDYEYNRNGLLSTMTFTDRYGKESLNTEVFKYNSSDSLIYKKTTENTFSMVDSFIRDSNNKTLIHKTYIKKDTLVQFKEFTYDSDDNIKVVKRFNKGRFLLDSIGFKYNDAGLISEEYVYNRNEFDIYDYQNLHFYDNLGNTIKSKMHVDSDSSYTIIEREFYKNGELRILKTSVVGYTRFNRTIQEFDSLGNMTSHRIIDDHSNTEKNWSTQFDYDSKGNWISKKSYYQNKLRSITRRILRYE